MSGFATLFKRSSGIWPAVFNLATVAQRCAWAVFFRRVLSMLARWSGVLTPAVLVTAISTLLVLTSDAAEARLPLVAPQDAGFDPVRLARLDELIATAIAEEKMPGCVVCFGRRGQMAWLKAYGQKRLVPQTEPMTTDTVFDLASITKPMATATSVMVLIERGQLALSQKVVTVLPEFSSNEKDKITVRDLLTHQSGLIADNALSDYESGPEVAWQKICELPLQNPLGSKFVYSDVNFIVLGKLVEKISGRSLHEFSQQELFVPLGLSETGFLPGEALKNRAAPTQERQGRWLQGEVHDPRAALLGGVAGHAGLFSTATDVAAYANCLLKQGRVGDQQILSPAMVSAMTKAYSVPGGLRGLGWDKRTGYSINRGDLLSDSAFGHGGFTGTVLWIDPERNLYFIFLSNRVHPNGKGLVNPLAGKLLNVVAGALEPATAAATQASETSETSAAGATPVLTGIDVLVREEFRALQGRKVGLITNHTGVDRAGRSTVTLLHQAPGVELKALFSPEHGFAGTVDIPKVDDSVDNATGLKVFSLYGDTRRPTAEMLATVDTLVFDIQDIGCRFYTYVSTMGEAMIAAAEHGKEFVVLDRPNPINGVDVAGPMLDPGKESFVGFHHLPVRHGMTIGELAQLIKEERQLPLKLSVIRCEGWKRSEFYESTGLLWINPSPNMRTLNQAVLYPGIGMLETTNLSVGRGTDTPFEIVGAPWLDGRALAAKLAERRIPGVAVVPVEFTPDSSKFANQKCSGVQLLMTDRAALQPVRLGLELAAALRQLAPETWETKSFPRLMGNQAVQDRLLQNGTTEELLETSLEGVSEFLRRRSTVLLYE
jgi:uncharacterized protein YbbC (DUF1343 family)/CubicO group peptidase (beta-lactamase class C family)